jgi:hypothetical protein
LCDDGARYTLTSTPIAQGALADLAAITFDNFIERQKYWLGHMRPPRRPDASGTKGTIILRGLILARSGDAD